MVSKLLMILPLLNQPYYSTSATAGSSIIPSFEVNELYSGMLCEDMMILNPVGVLFSSSLDMTR